MRIRQALPEDAERFIELNRHLDHESALMLFEPGERRFDLERQRDRFKEDLGSDWTAVLVAEHDHQLVGFAGITRARPRRVSHVASLVLGVSAAYHRRGVGSQLMSALEVWARDRGVIRLELTVISHNEAAIALYRKFGFKSEGIRRGALVIDGKLTDELYMAKLLDVLS